MSEEKEAKGWGVGEPEGAPDDFKPQEVRKDADNPADARPERH